jgi:hypothetical protein
LIISYFHYFIHATLAGELRSLFDDMPFHAAMYAYAIIAIVVMPAVAAYFAISYLLFHFHYAITPLLLIISTLYY